MKTLGSKKSAVLAVPRKASVSCARGDEFSKLGKGEPNRAKSTMQIAGLIRSFATQ
jgi:hypothetical protein